MLLGFEGFHKDGKTDGWDSVKEIYRVFVVPKVRGACLGGRGKKGGKGKKKEKPFPGRDRNRRGEYTARENPKCVNKRETKI